MDDDILLVEKYRPKTIDDCILSVELKNNFKKLLEKGHIPNLLLVGPPGVGKTTIAKAMVEELKSDYIMINGSLNRGIDVLRGEIQNFASTASFTGDRKFVIIDEADYLAPMTQPALRNFMEQFSKSCSFILTCNFKNRIIEPLQSRCSVIDFSISKKEAQKLASLFFKRVLHILDTEKIQYDKSVVAEVINKYFPDWRRTLNELQRYSATGCIDTGIFATVKNLSLEHLISLMKSKSYTEIRHWVKENIDNDYNQIYREFYDKCSEYIKPSSIPPLVMLIAKYQYQGAFSADQEVNFMAFVAECIIELDFL